MTFLSMSMFVSNSSGGISRLSFGSPSKSAGSSFERVELKGARITDFVELFLSRAFFVESRACSVKLCSVFTT